MMLPLVLEDSQFVQPQDVALRDGSGRIIQSSLLWLETGEAPDVESWTTDPRHIRIRPLEGRESAEGPKRLLLLARLPRDGDGDLYLGEQRLRPVWRDMPEVDYSRRGGQLALIGSPSRPDPRSPFEYWRWVVLADAFDVEPPDTAAYGEQDRLVAEHFADLWSIALARMEEHDAALVARMREVLTRICMDEHHAFAAWPADSASLSRILGLLLDFTRPDEAIAAEASAWLDRHEKPLMWIESATSDRVDLAIVNPAGHMVVARLSWVLDDVARSAEGAAVPLAVQLPEGRLTRVRMERPIDEAGNRLDALRVQVGTWAEQFLLGPPRVIAQPPGLSLPPLQPALTLARVQMDQPGAVPGDWATLVQIRKRAGRWEVFLECRRPLPDADSQREGRSSSERHDGPDQVRGREGVLLFVGDDVRGEAHVQVFIPETGWHQFFRGENDGTMQVHRRSYSDRWYCRIVLPERWLNTLIEGDLSEIGLLRTHRDANGVQYLPYPAPPWRLSPGVFSVDLTQWDDLPGSAGR